MSDTFTIEGAAIVHASGRTIATIKRGQYVEAGIMVANANRSEPRPAVPPLTQCHFDGDDFEVAERMAQALGYEQTAYTSTSALIGLFCLPENPARFPRKPHTGGCIIKTREFGLMFVQTLEDVHLDETGHRE